MSGAIEIAFVAMANGQQIGNRAPIAALRAGDMILAPTPAAACRLVARSADLAHLEPLCAPTASMLDAWTARLGQGVLDVFGDHPGGVLLLPGDTTRIPADGVLRGGHQPAWGAITEGTLHLLADPRFGFEAGAVLPLTAAAWLSAGPEGATLGGVTTTEALLATITPVAAGKTALEAVATWQASVLDAIASHMLAREAEEQARARRSAQWSLKVLRATRDGVAGALSSAPLTLGDDDPLVAACRIVAHEMGVELPDRPEPLSTPGRGRLDRIARATRMPVRRIILEDGWWRNTNRPNR